MFEKLLIYVVDDEALIVRSLERLLNKNFSEIAEVRSFTRPQDVITAMETAPCDLLVSDIRMPGMTGLEMIERLHREGLKFETVMLTGYDMFEYAYEAIRQDTCAYVLKNEPDDVLISEIGKTVAKILKQQETAESIRKLAADNRELKEQLSRGEIRVGSEDDGEDHDAEVETRNDERIRLLMEQIRKYISENLEADLSVSALARATGYSETHLSRLFRNSQNTSLHDYVLECRLARTCELLSRPDLKIGDIGTSCGFANTAYFIRVFKSRYKLTPGEYRLRLKPDYFSREN